MSSCAWRQRKGLAAAVGEAAWSTAEGRKAPSRSSFARVREIVPQPRGHVGTPHPRGQEPVLVGPQGTGGTQSPLPSAKQPVASVSPATPARLTVPFPGPWGHPQSGHSSWTMGPLLCHEPPGAVPSPSGAWGAGSSQASACRAAWHQWACSPPLFQKACAGAVAAPLPLTSGVLTHSCTRHFNPVKAIPSSNNNTATSCVRNPRYGIPPNPLLLSKAFTAFDLAHAVLGVGIVHSAR